MPLQTGQVAPWFTASTPSNPRFAFDSAAGRYVLMLFTPADREARGAAMRALAERQALFDDARACAFVVLGELTDAGGLKDVRGLRWFLDPEGGISRLFGGEAHWLLLDPALRVMAVEPVENAAAMLDRVAALPSPADHAGTPLHAPVLIAPRIFEPELCQALIELHARDGGRFTGVMRDEGGPQTVAVMDPLKKRRDILVDDPELQAAIHARLDRRLFPLIRQALGFAVTQVERLLVSCYAADDGGVFHPHRDSTTQGTAHRRFACSLNLNDDFDGGDLRFGEYGPATYRAPVGGAVVFSCAIMHEATRITRGERYAFLPFFFDDAAAQVLADYNARLAALEPVRP